MELLAKKSVEQLRAEAAYEGEHSLRRALSGLNLITLGIGAIIGAGIFVLTGAAAAKHAGPAVMLSFIVAGIACTFAGLCYAEFASVIPIAGSAYTYGYATLGELFAWIIGWDLILEYAFGAATVAVGWSGYFGKLLAEFGLALPAKFTNATGTPLVQYNGVWQTVDNATTALRSLNSTTTADQITAQLGGLPHDTAIFNFVAMAAILIVSAILIRGIKESANLNSIIVIVKLVVVLTFIVIAFQYLAARGFAPLKQNWSPFIPPETPDGEFGWSGIMKGASFVFFAYIGFDAVSTAAQEARHPQKDMPIGILGSLTICTILYILVSGLLTAIVPYRELNVPDPIAVGIDRTGVTWGRLLVKLGSVAGLGSVMLVMLLGQSRVLFAMANDGLLWEWTGRIHPKYRTPYISTAVVGVAVALTAGFAPIDKLGELVNIGTLLAFVIVCAGVWVLRVRQPDLPRAFKTPMVPLVPILGMGTCLYLMYTLPGITWIRLFAWLVIGMVIYFSYGSTHSKVQRRLRGEQIPNDPPPIAAG